MSGSLMTKLVTQLGPLRLMLVAMAIIAIFASLEPGTPAIYAGREFATTVLAPVLTPLVFMLLILDTLMSFVMMSAREGSERARYKVIIITNLLLALIMVFYWLPYYLALGD